MFLQTGKAKPEPRTPIPDEDRFGKSPFAGDGKPLDGRRRFRHSVWSDSDEKRHPIFLN